MDGRDVALVVFCVAPAAFAALAARHVRRVRAAGPPRLAQLLAGNALVLLAISAVAALGGELWFRFGFDSTDQFGVLETTSRWMERNYRMNNYGVRDDVDYAPAAPPGGRRNVTFLGDSFLAGHGVADVRRRFANLVREARPAWDVRVFGSNGLDTGREIKMIDHDAPELEGAACRYDVVVLSYCLNDALDILPDVEDLGRRIGYKQEKPFLARNSYLFDVLRLVWIQATDPEVRDYFPSVVDAYSGHLWYLQTRRLRQIENAVTSRGGRLAVVTFPFLHNLGPDYPFRDAHRALGEFWRGEGVPHLDLLDAFSGRSARDLVVGALDAHPNEDAHALAAAAILPFLDEVMAR